eukprot:CAMPEP_0185841436 /NCGR_PEP_ID=MMETSP1353-20130828/17889_1 /TAXON_ID=1077150 /ORGANISM="Erythrolobus australicus, Strain CCMP3124" /LENGTH=534 /DNA_ID=CAMNT_0028540907 /DNA_START=61 /DNA_END=1665 /DNA_ORIENTATION=-
MARAMLMALLAAVWANVALLQSSALASTPDLPPGKPVLITMNIGGATAGDYRTENQKWWIMKPDSRRKLIVDAKYMQPPELADVFRSQVSSHHDDLRLKIPVMAGVYKVHLMFAELWPGAFNKGKRLFDIQVGTYMCGELTTKKDFDVFATAGAGYTGIVETIPHIVTRGGINIVLKRTVQNPILNGIVIEGVETEMDDVNNIGCQGFAGVAQAPVHLIPEVPSAVLRAQARIDKPADDFMQNTPASPSGPRFDSSSFGAKSSGSNFGSAEYPSAQAGPMPPSSFAGSFGSQRNPDSSFSSDNVGAFSSMGSSGGFDTVASRMAPSRSGAAAQAFGAEEQHYGEQNPHLRSVSRAQSPSDAGVDDPWAQAAQADIGVGSRGHQNFGLEQDTQRFPSMDEMRSPEFGAQRFGARSFGETNTARAFGQPEGTAATCVNTDTHCSCALRSNNAVSGEMCLFEFDGARHIDTGGALVCRLGECQARYECSCEGASAMCEKTFESTVLMPLERPTNGYLRCAKKALDETAVILKPVRSP